MKEESSPLREIRVILNGTCSLPAYLNYAYRDKMHKEVGVNIHSDVLYDSIAQSYIPSLKLQTTYHKHRVKLHQLQTQAKQLTINKKAISTHKKSSKEVQAIYYQESLLKVQKEIQSTQEYIDNISAQLDKLEQTSSCATFFDQLGETAIGNSRIKLGIYRGPGTQPKDQLQDALFGQSMARRINKVAEEIYESLLQCAQQTPLPQVNVQGFSRGGYSALLVTEKLNYLIEHGNRHIDESLIKQKRLAKTEAKRKLIIERQQERIQRGKSLRSKALTIHCCANDPVPGLGSTRSTGIYHFDRPHSKVENHIFTHYNTGHNIYGFQGEGLNQILSSLGGVNQNQHVQSGFIKHGSLQTPVIKNELCTILDEAFAYYKKHHTLPEYFHPHTLPGLYTVGMFIRDINKTYQDDPVARQTLTDNIVATFNTHIKHANKEREDKIPYIQAPSANDLGLINLFMKETLIVQKFKIGSLIREHTGGKQQEAISEQTMYYAQDRARTALVENISNVPSAFNTESILSKLNQTNVSKTLLQQRWHDIIASGQNPNKKTIDYDPNDFEDTKATSFFMNWLLGPLYQIYYLLTTNNQQLTRRIKLRDVLKLQIKTSIIELKKSTITEFHTLMNTVCEDAKHRRECDTLLEKKSHFDTIKTSLAINNSYGLQAQASTYEREVQSYIISLANEPFEGNEAIINHYAKQTSSILNQLDVLYQKVHTIQDISKQDYQKHLQRHTQAIIQTFTDLDFPLNFERVIHHTIEQVDAIATSLNGYNHLNSVIMDCDRVFKTLCAITNAEDQKQYASRQLHILEKRLNAMANNPRYLVQMHTENPKKRITITANIVDNIKMNILNGKDEPIASLRKVYDIMEKMQKEEYKCTAEHQLKQTQHLYNNLNSAEKNILYGAYTNLHAAGKNLIKGIKSAMENFYKLLQAFVDALRKFYHKLFIMQKEKSYGFCPNLQPLRIESRNTNTKKSRKGKT